MSENEKTPKGEIIDITPIQEENKVSEAKNPAKEKGLKKIFASRLGVAISATVCIILIIVLIICLIMHLSSSKGKRVADNITKYIGESPKKAEQGLDISLKERSDFSGINNAVKFDRIYESEESITVDDITYPEWAVFVTLDENPETIITVKYTDFSIIEKNLSGLERKSEVDLSRFDESDSFGTISDEIGLDYYSVAYTNYNVTYVYKYWYKTETGDKQAVLLTAKFSKKNKFLEYKSERLYPPNL